MFLPINKDCLKVRQRGEIDMAKRSGQRIGADQLVYGMPKHMVGVSTKESLARFTKTQAEGERRKESPPKDPEGNFYWTVHPKPKACDKCKALEGKEFME